MRSLHSVVMQSLHSVVMRSLHSVVIRSIHAKSPFCGNAKSPFCGNAKSPFCGNAKSPFCGNAKSSFCGNTKSPFRVNAKSPFRGNGKSPFRGNGKSTFRGIFNVAKFCIRRCQWPSRVSSISWTNLLFGNQFGTNLLDVNRDLFIILVYVHRLPLGIWLDNFSCKCVRVCCQPSSKFVAVVTGCFWQSSGKFVIGCRRVLETLLQIPHGELTAFANSIYLSESCQYPLILC